MRIRCQRILIHFLLIIPHKLLVIARCCPLPYLLPDLLSPIAIAVTTQLMVYIFIGVDNLHKEEKGDIILVVVPTDERGEMMLVVVPTLILTSSSELSL